MTAKLHTRQKQELVLKKDLTIKLLDLKHIENYTSFITGFGGKRIGTKSGALFELTSEVSGAKFICVYTLHVRLCLLF